MSLFSKVRRIDAELRSATLDGRQGRLRTFAHDVAELSGQDQAALAGHAGRFDEENVAAYRRPCEAGRDTGNAGAQRDLAFEAGLAEHGSEIVRADRHLFVRSLRDLHRGMPQRLADFPLERPDAGLARVALDDQSERFIFDPGLVRLQAIRLQLAAKRDSAALISSFSSSVYPARLMISIRSSNGPGTVSSMLAVAMNATRERSKGTPR